MVRKSPRNSAKNTEKKSEVTRRSGTRASTRRKKVSSSDDSDDEVLSKTLLKIRSPNRSEKNSSDNEGSSDRDSKKPLKKRVRSGRNRASSTVKIDKKEDEVTEDKKSKGKSKGKNKSNNDAVVNQDIQNENAHTQVTTESPQNDDDNDEKKSEQNVLENIETAPSTISTTTTTTVEEDKPDSLNGTDNNETSVVEIENVTEQQKNIEQIETVNINTVTNENVKTDTNDVAETVPTQPLNVEVECANVQPEIAKEAVLENLQQNSNAVETSSEGTVQDVQIPSIPQPESEQIAVVEEQKPAETPSNDKIIENVSQQDVQCPLTPSPPLPQANQGLLDKEKVGNAKKILLKRPRSVTSISDEQKNEKSEHSEEWTSSYESNKSVELSNIDNKNVENEDDKHNKKISLKRQISEERTRDNFESRRRRSSRDDKHRTSPERSEKSPSKEKKRRHSSVHDDESREHEKSHSKPKKPSKPVKLKRLFNQDNQTFTPPLPAESSSSTVSEDGYNNKKSKWDSTKILSGDSHSLTLHAVKDVCPNIQFVSEQEVDLDINTLSERKVLEKERHRSFNEMDAEEMDKIEAELNAEPEKIRDNIIATNRKISIVDDTASKLKPPPSPARKPVSEILFITNLVRPFTVKQLKELLERTGKIRQDGFWTDRIKSKCYVYYETVEEAESTRNALHGVHWPIGNGKKLIIDYGSLEEMENAKNPPPPAATAPLSTQPVAILAKEKQLSENETPKLDYPDSLGTRTSGEQALPLQPSVRDWDIGKLGDRGRRSRSRSRHNKRVAQKSHTPEDLRSKKKRREEPIQQKAMDDLFLKTKATPSVYWQPLSPEEIALKQQQRQARLEENKRRMEELRSSGRAGGGGTGGVSASSSRDQRERDRGRDRNFRRR